MKNRKKHDLSTDMTNKNVNFTENGTQTGYGLVFHEEENKKPDGPPGILARKKTQE